MFTRETDASKVALVHLVRRLNRRSYKLLDVQFLTDHLRIFGAEEVAREDYQEMLAEALAVKTEFYSAEELGATAGESSLQSTTQMS